MDMLSPRGNSWRTMNENELSESLVYLTCPICGKVLQNEPVFTPCHHTFCGDCIRGRLAAGDATCAECFKPLKAADLQPNTMALNLLNSLKTCCVYKSNGCPWKAKVNELSAHQAVCTYAVTVCQYGCGQKVDSEGMHAHQKRCEYRPVNDCPCGHTFRFNQRREHRQTCLAWHQQMVPSLRLARDQATHELAVRSETLKHLRLRCAKHEATTISANFDSLAMFLAMAALVACEARPDASLAVALYLVVSCQACQLQALRLGRQLLAGSVFADVMWAILLGPRPFFVSTAIITNGEAEAEPAVGRPFIVGLVGAVAALKAALFLLLPKVVSTLEGLQAAQRDFDDEGKRAEAVDERRRSVIARSPTNPVSSRESGGAPLAPLAADNLADEEARAWPSLPFGATSPPFSPLRLWLDSLGWILFAVALWGCICRADAGAAVALLVLTTVRESHLYFSRVLLGATALSLSLDAVWLQQEMPEAAAVLFGSGGLRALVVLAAQLPLREHMAMWCLFLSFPVKLLLLLTGFHLLCFPLTVEAQPFRFNATADVSVFDTVLAADSAATVSGDTPGPLLAAAPQKGSGAAQKIERRRLLRVHEMQQQRAKGAVTVCFLGLLLATACAPLRQTLSGMEVYVFTMLAAYGCLRHSHICASQPLLCRAMLGKAMRLLLLSLLVEVWRVARDRDMLLHDWSVLSLTEKVSFASCTADVLLLLVLLYVLLRLLPTLQATDVSGAARRLWLSRTRRAAFAAFGLAMGATSLRREPDCAVLALALFATTEDAETLSIVQHLTLALAGGGAARVGVNAAAMLPACFASNPARRAGGLLTAILLCSLTAAADVWAIGAPLRADGSLLASAEPSLLLLKLVAKGVFGGCAVRLLNARRPASQHELVASVQKGSNLLHIASALLLGTVCLVSAAHTLSVDAQHVEWLSAYSIASLDAADAAALAIAIGLATGPTAALAVAGCGVALGSGGRWGSVLVIASSLVLFLIDATWLGAGPLRLRWGDLTPLGSGAFPDRWQGLPPPLMGVASTFLLQLPLKLAICIATTYRLSMDDSAPTEHQQCNKSDGKHAAAPEPQAARSHLKMAGRVLPMVGEEPDLESRADSVPRSPP